jgi:hypothetical protein
MRRTSTILAVAAVVLGLATTACGDEPDVVVLPIEVPEGLVPASVQGDRFKFFESELPSIRESFANAGADSLAADGRLWELRLGDRLVGSLQVSSLMPEVDLENPDHRKQIVGQILPTSRDQFDIDDVTVWSSAAREKTVYLWFSRQLFAVLTLKGGSEDELDPEQVLTEVVAQNVVTEGWDPLYIDDAVDAES